ncbi:MAG: ATP-grasp domain-containing protein [Hespellia sp.]|nr:ATP-grasp domain-containing protein [Hespellia sp.]
MADVFRILERFKITGRGTVYTIKNNRHDNISIGDILCDLQGNRFRVKGVEMFRRYMKYVDLDEMPLGLMFELLDGVEAKGNILIRSLEDIHFLFCSHPLYPSKVDEEYMGEYQAAGLKYPCALFNYEDMERGKLTLNGEELSGLTIYRGWMMKPDMYRAFYSQLEQRGMILINSPEEYERYHTLPGWYEEFKEYTAESIWENQGSLDNALEMTKGLEGPYIVKDYVKSRKHEWYDACFIKNIADRENAGKIISNFIQRQGTDLVGGIVLRRLEDLKCIGFHEKSGMPLSEEYRIFVYAGKIHILDDYWKNNQSITLSDDERKWIGAIAEKIKSNFVTIDLARRTDGTIIIMELGDGQVSGLQQIKAENFYKRFEICK